MRSGEIRAPTSIWITNTLFSVVCRYVSVISVGCDFCAVILLVKFRKKALPYLRNRLKHVIMTQLWRHIHHWAKYNDFQRVFVNRIVCNKLTVCSLLSMVRSIFEVMDTVNGPTVSRWTVLDVDLPVIVLLKISKTIIYHTQATSYR